jgi:hypothetical protein
MVNTVGNSWRTGGDIRPQWSSIIHNALGNDRWASNARPGHYNDADMLEIGNGNLTLAEQRSHFALWCIMKSPLLIGADVRAISLESLGILKNERLISINQDDLGIQGTLRATFDYSNGLRISKSTTRVRLDADDATGTSDNTFLAAMGICTTGTTSLEQKWRIADGKYLIGAANLCLARSSGGVDVSVHPCDESDGFGWNFGRVNRTLSQIRDPLDAMLCLAFNGSALHMEPCRKETSDEPTPQDCTTSRCKYSSLTDQLWYLNSLLQLSSAYTNFKGGIPPGTKPRNTPTNTPMCLSAVSSLAPKPPNPPLNPFSTSSPLQIWAGPLSRGNVVVLLLNTGHHSSIITASWSQVGLEQGTAVRATDLWTGASMGVLTTNSISATVGMHDVAAIRLSPI